MYFKENLRYLRKKYHITQNDLAEKFGYKSFTTIQKWEDGTSMPKMSILQQLADFFNLTIERLINQDLTRDEMSGVRVPVLGSVKAGYDHLAEQIVEDYEWVSPDEARGGEYFYLDVVGDSMKNARIEEGDRVYIHRQNSVDNGQIAVVLLENDEVTLKRVFYKDGDMILAAGERRLRTDRRAVKRRHGPPRADIGPAGSQQDPLLTTKAGKI